MNVEIETETPIFLFWEYLFQKFGVLSLQWGLDQRKLKRPESWYVLDFQNWVNKALSEVCKTFTCKTAVDLDDSFPVGQLCSWSAHSKTAK